MRIRFLGMPVPIIVIGLAVLLVAGGAWAAFFMERDIPSSVRIIGVEGAEVYANEACTIPLTELDFGDIRPGEATDPVPFWVKNESDAGAPSFYVALSQTGLDQLLGLYQGGANLVPANPNELPLVTGSDYEEGYWEAGIPSTTILGGVDASATLIEVASNDGFDAAGDLYCEGEVIAYAGLQAYIPSEEGYWEAGTPSTTILGGVDATATIIEVADIGGFVASGNLYSEGEVIAYTGLRAYEAGVPEVPGYWQETGIVSYVYEKITSGATQILSTGTAGFPVSGGTIKIDDELMSYASIGGTGDKFLKYLTRGIEGTVAASHDVNAKIILMEWVAPIPAVPEVLAAFTDCTRGAEGTVAAAHSAGAAISKAAYVDLVPTVPAAFTGCTRGTAQTTAAPHAADAIIAQAEYVSATGGVLYELAPNEVLPVSVHLEADPAITWATYPFTLWVYAQDTPY